MEAAPRRDRIVVGVDGSDQARHALAWARDEAVIRSAALHVVHAWAPPVPVSEIAAMASPVDETRYEACAHEVLDAACATISVGTPESLVVESTVVRGYPSTVLLEHAADADLLVVGSRGRGGFSGLLLGSVSHQCVHHATRPIAVIPTSAPLPGTGDVVVGVDGSAGSASALRWAVDEAAARGARLGVVHAWTTPYPLPPGGIAVVPIDPREFLEESEHLLHQMVDGAVARADRRPRAVELLSVEEPAAPALLHRAEGADLLVVGSRGRGIVAGLLLGSVSQHCVHRAPCAVVVVPHLG
ncbi:MAG: universal stress protein [Microthrixaceae bacterium]